MNKLFSKDIKKILAEKSINILLEKEDEVEAEESDESAPADDESADFEFPADAEGAEDDSAEDDSAEDDSAEDDTTVVKDDSDVAEEEGISIGTLETLFDQTVTNIDDRLKKLEKQFSEFYKPSQTIENSIDNALVDESYFKSTISSFLLQEKDSKNTIENLKAKIDQLTDFSELIKKQFDNLNTITVNDVDKLASTASKIIIDFDKFEHAWSQIQKYVMINSKDADRDEIIRLLSDKFIKMCQEKFNTDVSSIVGQSVENPVNFKTAPSGSTA